MYYINHRVQRVWVRQLKVASVSLSNTINVYSTLMPDAEIYKYINYEWVTVVRHPLERLRSYWTSPTPPKQHSYFEECVHDILEGVFVNPHITPQYHKVRDFKMPEYVFKYEELEQIWPMLMSLFHSHKNLPRLNKSTNPIPWQEFISADLIPALRDYYKDDFTYFNYD